MKTRLKQILIGGGMIALMTFLFVKTNVIESGAHNEFSERLRHLKELNATLDKDVLESRYGLMTAYDRLTYESAELDKLQAELASVPAFMEPVKREAIVSLLGESSSLQNKKKELIERFKSRNAIINNSLRYFPVATSDVLKDAGGDPETQKDTAPLNDLLRDILTYYLLTDSELKPSIARQIEHLEELKDPGSGSGGKGNINITLSHARTIVKLKPEVDDLVTQIVSLPTDAKIEEIIKTYDSFYKESSQVAGTYRLLLYILSVFLLAYVTFIIFKLKKATSALNVANENLEQRVQERTEELSHSNVELQKSETNNTALLRAIPDSMWRTDKGGILLDYIPAKEEFANALTNGWQGKTIFDLLPSDIAKQTLRLAKESLRTGSTQVFEYQMRETGTVQHFEGRVAVCGESEILTIVRNVTDVRRAEAQSKVISDINQGISTTSNLHELLDHIHHSISKILYAENCFVVLYDKNTEMLDLQLFVDKYDERPPVFKLGRGMTAYVFRTGQPALLQLENIHELIASGEIEMVGTPPAVWLGVPLRTPNGVIGVLVVQHYEDSDAYKQYDLEVLSSVGDQIAVAIERKRADEALRASEARFQSAFDHAPIGIGLVSPDGRWQQANRSLCEIVGYTTEELRAVTFADITHPDDLDKSLEVSVKLLSGEAKTCQLEKRYIHKDGHHVLVLTSLSLVRDTHDQPLYIIAQIQDITERKSLEEKVQRGQKLESIGQLAAGIAHEINTPTQYVGDNVRFLQDSFLDVNTVLDKNAEMIELCRSQELFPEFVAEMEKTIDRADLEYLADEVPKAFTQALDGVERIRKIVQSMKDFAHPGSTDMRATDLNRAIESTITVASNEWKYVADLVTNYDELLPAVPCLAGEFNQVILNMIVNASHAISDVVGDGSTGKGTINITTRRNGEFAEIRISDSGGGIPEDIRKKIFDPFFTTKEVGKGTGQGLAISHSVIVDKHKGTIDVESETGKGTTFIIQLPVTEASANV
jgi:PAS domain S-box-containing protein